MLYIKYLLFESKQEFHQEKLRSNAFRKSSYRKLAYQCALLKMNEIKLIHLKWNHIDMEIIHSGLILEKKSTWATTVLYLVEQTSNGQQLSVLTIDSTLIGEICL
jgi:hypothetical protein